MPSRTSGKDTTKALYLRRGDDAGTPGQPAGILYQSPIDFGPGAGDNGQLGRAPGLAASPIAGSREPTPTEVEQASRTVKAAFEIGKPGSEFENGVPDIETAKAIARAINITAVVFADTHGKLASRTGKAINRKVKPSRVKGSAGFYVSGSKGTDPVASAIGINTTLAGPSYRLFALLHEIGHGLETRRADRDPYQEDVVTSKVVYSPTAGKDITMSDDTYADTFREVLRQVLNIAGGRKSDLKLSQKEAQEIIFEIVAMQREGVLQRGTEVIQDGNTTKIRETGRQRVSPQPTETVYTPIRQDYRKGQMLVEQGALTQAEVDTTLAGGERDYFHTPFELAADLLAMYMLDPAGAKATMPKASRLAQIVFRDNPTIQFFSLPFASIVAMVLANMLIAEGEEEEDMDPGALSMSAGALTA